MTKMRRSFQRASNVHFSTCRHSIDFSDITEMYLVSLSLTLLFLSFFLSSLFLINLASALLYLCIDKGLKNRICYISRDSNLPTATNNALLYLCLWCGWKKGKKMTQTLGLLLYRYWEFLWIHLYFFALPCGWKKMTGVLYGKHISSWDKARWKENSIAWSTIWRNCGIRWYATPLKTLK